ncbi:protein-methionine-sulfoxide reductase catalytic subunit MsrP [Haliea sp. E17]|uniref:protein-methionine-sulfoxide reductase catalytic subunit MsrP n=1 Tax=Haliea sp. E17 TaxID=3401576 RepID=UPI003AB0CF4B
MSVRFRVPPISSSEITPESVYLRRREIMKAFAALSVPLVAGVSPAAQAGISTGGKPLEYVPASQGTQGFYTDERLTPREDAASYNNFFEFGTGKSDPANYAGAMSTDPWTVEVDGEVDRPGKLHLEDILGRYPLEERIYRLRCVERWSMVIPWVGFPLASLLQDFQPTSRAKFVAFETLYRRSEMPGTRSFTSTLEWPYVEGLRIDEATHPLAFLAVGNYGKTLPNQHGAPIRLVVPWKYGYKSIKSIVRISLVEKQPPTAWNKSQPREYGFYSNVNPQVDHPRWSQQYERRLPGSLFEPREIPTLMFNGYEEQVASLYTGMDLRKYH